MAGDEPIPPTPYFRYEDANTPSAREPQTIEELMRLNAADHRRQVILGKCARQSDETVTIKKAASSSTLPPLPAAMGQVLRRRVFDEFSLQLVADHSTRDWEHNQML